MKKNIPLIVGISLPIVFIIILSAVIFGPSLFSHPQYNFLYVTSDPLSGYNQEYQNTYSVKNGTIDSEPVTAQPNQVYKPGPPVLYEYDLKTNSSHQVDLATVKTYKLDPGPSSPDGYTIHYEYANDGIFDIFGGGNRGSNYYIEKNNDKRELVGLANTYYYYESGEFQLIGWIQ